MAETSSQIIDEQKLKKAFDISHFDLNAVIRGIQLTLVVTNISPRFLFQVPDTDEAGQGAHRALQNPNLFTSDHYRQAGMAVAAGIAIRLLVAIPVCLQWRARDFLP